MSDVVVSTTASTTVVTTSSTAVNIAVNTYPVTVSASSVGLQGPTGANGAAGATGATGATGPQGSAGAQGSAGVGYAGITSTSSITIGTGLKTWTVSSVGAFVPGMRIRAINTNSTTNWVEGPANVASGTTIIITVDKTAGSGTFTAWTFAATGEIGAQGNTGAQGTAGASGVISVTAPITNTGTSSSAIIGLDQTGLSLVRSQISDFTSGTVAVATSATSANTALTAGTASYSTTSGSATNASTALTAGTAYFASTASTATYATTAGTSIGVSGSAITKSQISDFTSGTVAYATASSSATSAATATYSVTSGTASYATTAGTSIGVSGSAITRSQISDFTSGTVAQATNASTATYATTAGTSVGVSGSAITVSQISNFASGTVANISGTVTASQVSGLPAIYASLGSANSFTLGPQTLNTGASTGLAVTVKGASGQTGDLEQWQTSAGAVLGGVSPIGQIYTGSTGVITAGTAGSGFAATSLTSAAYTSATVAVFTYPLTVQVVAVGQKVAVTGVTGGTYNGVWTVTAIGGSSGAYTFTVSGSGFTNVAGSGGFFSVSASMSITANSQLTVPLIIQGAASQTARLIEFQNSSGTAIASIGASGGITATSVTSTGSVTISGASNPLTVGGTAGTSGQVLTSAGPGASPAWANASGGAPFGPRYLKSGYSYNPIGFAGSSSTVNNWTANNLYAVPFYVPNTITTVYLYIYASVLNGASGGIRVGIYNNSSSDDYPNARVVDAGLIPTDTTNGSVGNNLVSVSTSLTGGNLYWLVAVRQGASNPTIAQINAPNSSYSVLPSAVSPSWLTSQNTGWLMTGVSGALPTTFSATKTLALNTPLVGIGF
jgi:hypothetical protein